MNAENESQIPRPGPSFGDGQDVGMNRNRQGQRRSRSSGGNAYGTQVLTGLCVFLCLVLVWAPLPMGSNRAFYLFMLGALCGLAAAVWGGAALFGFIRAPRKAVSLWPAIAAFGIAMAIAGFQIIDLRSVDGLVGTGLSRDVAHPIWQLASESLRTPLPAYISVNPAKASEAFLKCFVYAAVFVLAFAVSRKTELAKALLLAVAASGAACVAAGIVQMALGLDIGAVLTDEVGRDTHRFNSTFSNANHFATFAGVALIASVGLTFEAMSKGVVLGRGRDIAMRTIISTVLGPALPGIACSLLLFGAVLMSASRAGSLAVLCGLAVFVALVLFTTSWEKLRKGTGIGIAVAAAILIAGGLFGGSGLMSRFDDKGLALDLRQQIFAETWDAAVAAPLTGNGFGAFTDYHPLYSADGARGLVNAAHNDYLEVLSDLGFAGGIAFILAPAYLAFLATLGAFRRRKGKIFSIVAASAAALCAAHALYDFSLQIPAVGVALFAVLGIGVAQSWRGEDEDGDPRMSA